MTRHGSDKKGTKQWKSGREWLERRSLSPRDCDGANDVRAPDEI